MSDGVHADSCCCHPCLNEEMAKRYAYKEGGFDADEQRAPRAMSTFGSSERYALYLHGYADYLQGCHAFTI